MNKKADDKFEEFRKQKKSLENFGSLASPNMSSKRALIGVICDYLNSVYGNPTQMKESLICGIVDAQKIYQRRTDYLTLEFAFMVLNNHLKTDAKSIFLESVFSHIDQDHFKKLSGLSDEKDLGYYSQSITLDRMIEIFECQHVFIENKDVGDFSARIRFCLEAAISSKRKIA